MNHTWKKKVKEMEIPTFFVEVNTLFALWNTFLFPLEDLPFDGSGVWLLISSGSDGRSLFGSRASSIDVIEVPSLIAVSSIGIFS